MPEVEDPTDLPTTLPYLPMTVQSRLERHWVSLSRIYESHLSLRPLGVPVHARIADAGRQRRL